MSRFNESRGGGRNQIEALRAKVRELGLSPRQAKRYMALRELEARMVKLSLEEEAELFKYETIMGMRRNGEIN